jgi:glyoxylase-like metal-dependent hydrolase (beta-lactamase superfamily II)
MSDVVVLPAHFPIPGAGLLQVNAFVIKAKEPILVDTGMGIDSEKFMEALRSVIDPRELKWVWLTHDDADHTGNLQKVLEAAPNARLAAYSLAVLRMSTALPVAMDRVYWLNPGDSIDVGDRKLTAVRPPLYDNPTTIGIYDDTSEAFFCADCFGAIIPSPAKSTDEISERDLAQGMIGWASLDNPWVHMVRPSDFSQSLDKIRLLGPKMLFSAHLPPATGKTEQYLELLATVPPATPSIAPGQAALKQILAQVRDRS